MGERHLDTSVRPVELLPGMRTNTSPTMVETRHNHGANSQPMVHLDFVLSSACFWLGCLDTSVSFIILRVFLAWMLGYLHSARCAST